MRTPDDIAGEEIARFRHDGLYWYDGISWLTDSVVSDADRDAAYEIVFERLKQNGRDRGMVDPYVHHNGNGHYVVTESKAP